MVKKTTKQKMRDCDLVTGMHILLGDPCITELCGKIGYDFLWIDTEHSATDHQVLLNHLIAATAAGCDTIVRVPWNDAIMAKRVLEMGPTGILFPVINTCEELDMAMKSTLYPPEGNRGFGPIRAVDYAIMDQEYYINHISREEMIRCVQIESKTAVDNLDEMVKNPWVDAFIIGPCDLSASIGHLYKIYEKPTTDLIREAAKKVRGAGKSMGISIATENLEQIQFWHDMGINVISCGSDTSHLINGSQRTLKMLKTLA